MTPYARLVTIVEGCLGGGVPPGLLASEEAERTVCHALELLAAAWPSRMSWAISPGAPGLRIGLPRELARRLQLACAVAPRRAARDDVALEDEVADLVHALGGRLGIDDATATRRLRCVLDGLCALVAPALPGDLSDELSGWAGCFLA